MSAKETAWVEQRDRDRSSSLCGFSLVSSIEHASNIATIIPHLANMGRNNYLFDFYKTSNPPFLWGGEFDLDQYIFMYNIK